MKLLSIIIADGRLVKNLVRRRRRGRVQYGKTYVKGRMSEMASLPVEQQIMERLKNLDDAQKRRVLDFVHTLQPTPSAYTARELLLLPSDERDKLVAAAFEAADDEDFEVFEAYSEGDLDA
jgi:hypothetical protein